MLKSRLNLNLLKNLLLLLMLFLCSYHASAQSYSISGVVQGAKETLKRCRPNLYLEADRRDKLPQLLQLLFDADYKIYWHIPPLFNADNAFDVKEDIFNIISINIICLPKESTMSVQGFLEVTSVNDWPR